VLYRERRKVGIGDEVAGRTERPEQFLHKLKMQLAGRDCCRTGLLEPSLHEIERLTRRERVREDTGLRG